MSPLLCTVLYSGDIRGEKSGKQSTINPKTTLFQAAEMFRLMTFREKQGKFKNIYRPHGETNHISSCPKKAWSNPVWNYKLIIVPGVAGNRSAASETNFTSLDICTLQPHPSRQKIHDLHAPLSRCFISDWREAGTLSHQGTGALQPCRPCHLLPSTDPAGAQSKLLALNMCHHSSYQL